jgi:phosphocarrier protein HPr
MKEASVVIADEIGLHLRTSEKLVRTAARFRSEVFVRRDDTEVNAKSILGVLMLAAETGATIVFRADGPDEDEAIAALVHLVEANFAEE